MELPYHIPALLNKTVEGLNIKSDGIYVDVTFGGGGHSREILKHLGNGGHLYGFDQDEDAKQNVREDERFTFVLSNFRYLKNFMRYYGVEKIDGVIADLGVSFHHFDEAERGFSFRFNGKLDMRMNQKAEITAADVINTYDEVRLANVFYQYGELFDSRRLARKICEVRDNSTINTVNELRDIVEPLIAKNKVKKELACLFQALRIEVNHEMDALKDMLLQSSEMLVSGGRLSVLTYHSLEDRIVKNFMKTGNFEGRLEKDFYGNSITSMKMINNKPITASDEEIEQNPRSRSAKLRVAEKL